MAYSLIEIASNNAQKAPSAMSMAVLGRSYNANAVEPTETESYNNGGFLGGVGYLGEKLAVGFMSSIEGIWDYSAGGLAKLFGADDWAEQQFANDWFGDWYSHPEEWYNPSDGWRTAGDIAGGIGTSLPSMLASIGAVAIAVGTAGAGTPISAGILSAIGGGTAAVTAGLGAAGTSTKQAYLESGQLTGKEFGYGALSGVTEGALEGVTTALSLGTGQIVKSVAGSFAKETAKTVAKQSVVKTLTKGFIGEAFEEGMAEVLDPAWQRLTYNPNAKNATPQEVAYAAFVGGMSGMLMGGAGAVYSSGNSFLKGNSLVGRGLDAEVVGLSQQLAAFETANNTGDETFQNIAQTYADLAGSLETTGGKVTTVTQKKLLGDLQRANTVAVFKPMIAKSAANIVNNAEVIAERLNAYGYKTADGKSITFTADQLRAGVDVNRPSSFSKALKTNSILRELAIADTTGHLVMDTARFEQATLMGKRLASQVDLNRFVETATPSEISAVSQALGIENWATLDVDTFNQKITKFVEDGGVQQYADRRATVQSIQAIPAEIARPMPKMVNLRQDGSVRYSDGSTQIAITRQGDAYTVYDYASGHLSKNMTRSEVNKLLRDYNTQQADITAGARAQMEAESELRRQAEELDTYARENITDYSKLSAPNQSMIRKLIREGRAKGMSDEDVLAYAKISAHAGIDISFDKQATFRGHDAEGKAHYVDGFYDPKTNRIVVNPEAKRSHERLLLHELEHTILNGKDGKKMIATAFKNMDEAMRNKIIDRYSKFYEGKGLDAADRIDIFNDEISAHFAEEILSNRHTLERLVEAEPTLKDKILSFFKGASEDYKSVPKLSRAARSYYKTYKKLFDEFAERNFQNNATEAQTARLSGEVKAQRRALPNSIGAYSDEERKSIEARKDNITAEDDVSEERIAAIRAELDEIRVQEREAKERKDALEDKERAQSYIEAATKDGITGEEIARLTEEYNRWADESGYAAASKSYEELTDRHRKLYAEQQRIEEKLSKQLLTREYTPEEVSKYVSKAVRRFHTTSRLNCAAYLLTTGSMLDFSEGQGYRVQDHREIADILDLPDYAQYSDGMIIFMNMGNIRLQTYGIDISAMPNSKQISALRGIIQRVMSEYDEFIVDFSTKSGYSDGSITYPKNIASSRIIFDIQSYFETGKLPEEPSSLSDFRYALPETNSDGEALTEQQKEYFKDSRTKDGQGRLLVLYHQTNAEFTEFDTQREGAGARDNETPHGIFLKPTDENIGLKGDKQMRLYANITNPLKFYTRADAQWYWKHNIDGYADILSQIAVNDRVYGEQFDEAFDLRRVARRKKLELSQMEGKEIDALYEESESESQKVLDEWKEANAVLDKKAKALIDEYLKENGYDGVFLLEDQGSFGRKVQTYIALSSEQVKNTDNAAPTASKDVRYALPETDSEGNALSAGQREYFADSKVLDENGNLMVMYHGTPNGAHNTFRSGSYFTPDASYADKYQNPSASSLSTGKTASNPKTYKVYLNITKPFDTRNDAERDIFQNEYYRKYGMGAPLSESGLPDWTDGMDLQEFIEEMGYDYDGLILDEGGTGGYGDEVISRGLSYVTFSSEQVKNVDNKNPTTDRDIRHALPDEDLDALFDDDAGTSNSAQDANFDAEAIVARGMPRTAGKSSLTVGELRKIIANNTKQKVYSKQDALSVVGRFAGISDLTQKTRTEIADAVWQILNESPDVEYRRDVAHDMAEFIVAKIIVDAKTENPDALEAQERLSYLRTGIGKLSFSEEDMSEIRHVRDKKGLKQVLGRWGYKGAHKGAGGIVSGKRTPMDVFVVDIAREMPAMEYLEEMHPVDAFLEIDSLYERVLAESKDKWISAYWDMPDSEIPGMIKSVEDEIMHAYETEGEQSKFSRMVENKIGYYSERAEYWKAEYDKIKGRDRLLGLLMSKAQKMKDLKLGTFANSTQHDSEIFKNSIEKLARIQFRGNLNVSGTRKILADLRQWYTSDTVKTGILEYVDGNNTGLYIQGVTDMLETLSEGKGGFTKDDLKMLYDVMSYFTNFVENWGKVFRQGKWIDAKSESERYVNILHANESLKVGLFGKLAGTTYMQTFGDPMTVARRMDRYESGFYTEMMQELRDAAVDAQVAEMEIRAAYDEFTKKHKKYVEKASVDTVTYRDTEIPKMHLIGLYMTMKRKHAWSGLVANGFAFTDTKGKRIRVNGVVSPEAKITNAELEQYAKKQLSAIEALLTDTDKEYIAILEQAFNVDARKLKADRDMQRLGFTNATDEYYYPIRRGNIAKNVDTADIAGELDRVSNSSFNKDTVRGAKQELFIESADAVFNRHIHAVCQYAYLSPAVEAYNRLYNLDISGNKNKPISVATESANTWAKGNAYFVKLISDIQGIPASSGEGMKALGFIRGSYAKFQLGANPKVWLTQLSSIFASSSLLDADSITRGMAVSASGIDKYCSLAKLRNNDNTAAMAQGVLDSKVKRTVGAVSKFSDLLMSPIGKMDRFVVCRIFGACQVQVQKNGGAKIGTEANKVEAGKLLRRVILETQQNAIATERSAAMRSGNEIMRTLTMFTSDSMKVVGRVIDAVGEVSTLKSKLKATTDADARTALKQQLNAANRKARKAVGALCLTAVFMASIAQLFRWLYDKEPDEDESVAETMLVDAVGNLFGGLPLFKDAYAKIFEGYDVDNYAYSALNDLLDSALNLFGVAGNILTNEGSIQERNRAMRDLAYSVGQLFGIPVRNIYNVFFGLTKRFNPETAYVIDNAFYEKNYQNELYKAIEEDDAEMTSFIMSLLLGERMNENVDEAVFNELLILSKNGQKVIPRSVPSSITIDEVEYPLSAAEQASIKDVYATSEKSLKALFAKSKYNTLSDEQKAAAIDFIYDTYYDKALEGALGIDRGNNNLVIADVVGVDNLALLYVTTKGLTSDMDRRGKVISGSKRKKVVAAINSLGVSTEKKLLLICAKGYSLQDNDIRGLSAAKAKKYLLRYILSLKGKTKAEKAEIAELCGFEVKNGGVVTKSVFSLG